MHFKLADRHYENTIFCHLGNTKLHSLFVTLPTKTSKSCYVHYILQLHMTYDIIYCTHDKCGHAVRTDRQTSSTTKAILKTTIYVLRARPAGKNICMANPNFGVCNVIFTPRGRIGECSFIICSDEVKYTVEVFKVMLP